MFQINQSGLRVQSTSKNATKKSILVIEHDEAMRSAICRLLYSEKFKVMSAQDGCLGFLLAKEFQPDLILCDINLPKLDGYGVLNKLRENLLTAKTPFIFISPNIDRFSHRRALQLGANDCLAEPLDKRELLEAIANQLKLLLANQG
ncbi:MAG TPA: response regulator [Coleofasciculaceae cyanobacterium]